VEEDVAEEIDIMRYLEIGVDPMKTTVDKIERKVMVSTLSLEERTTI